MQNVSDTEPEPVPVPEPFAVNVQHSVSVELLLQSDDVWQSWTVDVSPQFEPMWVGQASADVQLVPSVSGVQSGYVPVPSGTSLPQHTGVGPPHESGPLHASWSFIGHVVLSSHENVIVPETGVEQHTFGDAHAAPEPQANG